MIKDLVKIIIEYTDCVITDKDGNIINVIALSKPFIITEKNKSLFKKLKQSIGKVQLIGDMSMMFTGENNNRTNISPDIINWDVSKVTNMEYMFMSCNVYNLDLSKWDVSNVINMDFMFNDSRFANGNAPQLCDISDWDVGNVTTMESMFRFSDFCYNDEHYIDISRWNVENVISMYSMFGYCGQSINNCPKNPNNILIKWRVNDDVDKCGIFVDVRENICRYCDNITFPIQK